MSLVEEVRKLHRRKRHPASEQEYDNVLQKELTHLQNLADKGDVMTSNLKNIPSRTSSTVNAAAVNSILPKPLPVPNYAARAIGAVEYPPNATINVQASLPPGSPAKIVKDVNALLSPNKTNSSLSPSGLKNGSLVEPKDLSADATIEQRLEYLTKEVKYLKSQVPRPT